MTIFGHVAEVNLFTDFQLDCLTRQFPLQRFDLRKSGTFCTLIYSQQSLGCMCIICVSTACFYVPSNICVLCLTCRGTTLMWSVNLANVSLLRLPVQGLSHESLLGSETVLEGQASKTWEGQDWRCRSASETAGERHISALTHLTTTSGKSEFEHIWRQCFLVMVFWCDWG